MEGWLGLAGHQPTSRFSERLYLEKMKPRATKQDTGNILYSCVSILRHTDVECDFAGPVISSSRCNTEDAQLRNHT